MFKKECRCGKTHKNFKHDIGPFFINECCHKAGFDVYGNQEAPPKVAPFNVNGKPEQPLESKSLKKASNKAANALAKLKNGK